MAVVYKHTRMDNGLPFYIGIGKTIRRAKSKKSRNKYWHNIVNKYGYNIEILHTNVSWEKSCELEKKYIKQYGRFDLCLGPLVNMTDGGEGTINISDETKDKISKSKKGINKGIPLSIEHRKKISLSNKGKKKGIPLSDEHKSKISFSNKGKNIVKKDKNKFLEMVSGEKCKTSKLKTLDVLYIREKYIYNHPEFGTTPLSKKFNISKRNINAIINRTRWKHIQ
jgi:Mor family transcriptional regulator